MKKTQRRLEISAAISSILGVIVSVAAGIIGNVASNNLYIGINFWTIVSISIAVTVIIFTLVFSFSRGRSAFRVKIVDQEDLRRQVLYRFYRTLSYLSIYLYIIVLYSAAFVVDYLLISLIIWLIS